MHIRIDDNEIEINNGETLLETAKRAGYVIPSLCYTKGFKHHSSCMVCVVKNKANGQIIPSCTTSPVEGMRIETDSEEIRNVRMLSLELLLSDHRADCEAPCSLVCPQRLEVEQLLSYFDTGRYNEAYLLISSVFSLPDIACDTCKAPCEKACRRGTVDHAVAIREIIKVLIKTCHIRHCEDDYPKQSTGMKNKNTFQSRLGRFTISEKERLKTSITTPSRCLHCACAGRKDCKLREYATSAGIKRPRYEIFSALPAMLKQHIKGKMWFEQAKCIRCGLCVYNSDNGFTFKNRGFGIQVILPDENREHINEELASLCPTGALYIIS